ncbi:MAG: glycosyltransferase [Flavobacteriales bacterium]|nr:glycosyltransferase [Flavobacteriales bacterium]
MLLDAFQSDQKSRTFSKRKLQKTLHIVSFDIPYPANYGGVIDIFYKIKAFHEQGIRVILHCFEYGRQASDILNEYCDKVYYYPRKTFKNFLYGTLPYIVSTRDSGELLNNLSKDSFPILFEGLHSTFFLKDPALKNRFKIVRTHNVEHDYYHNLEMVENNFFKRYFFKLETEKLKKYQNVLKYADLICSISPNDTEYFSKKFNNCCFIPAFHSNREVKINKGMGNYVLYHGNLSVGENHQAAMFLIREVFSDLNIPFIIAGSHPKKELRNLVSEYKHVKLLDQKSTTEIHELIRDAQINVLYTRQDTGIKLKLLNALFNGRHCIVNHKMVDQTGLEELCIIGEDPEHFQKLILKYMQLEFDSEKIEERSLFFNKEFNNTQTIKKLIKRIDFNYNPAQSTQDTNRIAKKNKARTAGKQISSFFGLIPF